MTEVTTTVDPALVELLDRQAIREVMNRYCRGVDRRDADPIVSAYHPDAYDDHCGAEFTGENVGRGIAEWMGGLMDLTSHQITNQTITIDGDFAGCESYYMETHIMRVDDHRVKGVSVGRYVDRLERRQGEWRILHRRVVLETTSELPFDAAADAMTPRYWSNHREDPSYVVLEHPASEPTS